MHIYQYINSNTKIYNYLYKMVGNRPLGWDKILAIELLFKNTNETSDQTQVHQTRR